MDREHHVATGVLFNEGQESAELTFTSSRLNVPGWFGFPNYNYAFRRGIYVWAITTDFRRKAVG